MIGEPGESDKFLVNFKNEVYDISKFAHKHPGGSNTLKGLNNTDMDSRFAKAPPHSDAAMYLMQEYKVKNGVRKRSPKRVTIQNGTLTNGGGPPSNGLPNGKANGATKAHTNGTNNVQANGKTNEQIPNLNQEYFGKPDESMEHLVDWSSAMVPQIASLGHTYAEWVNMPVDRPLRLFASNWIESLTKTPWWLVPAFWIPTICYICQSGVQLANINQSSSTLMVLSFFGGLLLWTIVEYSLHRWVFHLNPAGASGFICTLHFLLHGLHHKVPFDPYRLVFPPVPALFLASVFYQPVPYLFTCPRIVISGTLLGYLIYDMIHYYIHYGSPAGGYLYTLKRYHYQHHFVHHDKGFGISSPVWDTAFGTKIFLRKLKYLLKW